MTIVLLLLGLIATVLGAIAPGATNVVVVKTTIDRGIHQALPIIYGAGVGEIVLAILAWYFGSLTTRFISMHLWIQVVISLILFIAGFYLIMKKDRAPVKRKRKIHPSMKGFLLSTINPPVLIYWVIVFSILQRFNQSLNNDYWVFPLFLGVIFIGKTGTLLGYARMGEQLDPKETNTKMVNKVMGASLLIISCIQLARMALT